ncbi:speckle-type POZ protein-like [Chironomus tepperi]|uniref:speckle-type POZ protein-like n=1 Tax=Chironomus tepperi TaxID=113505 RepID=UPI00391F9FD6
MDGRKNLRTPDFSVSLGRIQTEWSIFLSFNNSNGIDLYCNKNNPGIDEINVKLCVEIPISDGLTIKRSEEKTYTALKDGFRWNQLLSRRLIAEAEFQSLENDTLIIHFKMELSQGKKKEAKSHTLAIPCNSAALMNVIKDCYDSKAFSDVIFICSDGEKIPAHRLICSAYSPVMNVMFTGMREAKDLVVEVPDIDGKAMIEILRYIYTKSVCSIDVLAAKVLYGAQKYGLDELKSICLARMNENLSIENALEYFFVADRYNHTDLLRNSIEFIKSNYKILRETAKDWNNLNSKQWAMLLDHFNEQSAKYVYVFDSSM